MAYKVYYTTWSGKKEVSSYPKKTGRFGAINFKKHLKETSARNIRIVKVKK